MSRRNRPSTFLSKDRNNVLQVLQSKPDKYCPVCHFTVATILSVSLPISNTTGKIPIAIWEDQTVQDYHGGVLCLRVSTDVIHLSASGWLLLLQHHGACQLRKERTYVFFIVELMQRTTLNQDSFCFQFPSSYNNNEEMARFVLLLVHEKKTFHRENSFVNQNVRFQNVENHLFSCYWFLSSFRNKNLSTDI